MTLWRTRLGPPGSESGEVHGYLSPALMARLGCMESQYWGIRGEGLSGRLMRVQYILF
jgi:hypothetical protein